MWYLLYYSGINQAITIIQQLQGGGKVEVINSSMRWTPALYRAIKAQAEIEGISVNELVRNVMGKALGVKEDDAKKGGK